VRIKDRSRNGWGVGNSTSQLAQKPVEGRHHVAWTNLFNWIELPFGTFYVAGVKAEDQLARRGQAFD
jgi:hypothetical protein